MVGVFVKFQFAEDFEEGAITQIAESAKAMFVGLPGLRSKAFTFDADGRRATNFYVWESEGAARTFFTDETVRRIADFYGAKPAIEFVQIAALVENSPA